MDIQKSHMSGKDVIRILTLLGDAGIEVIVDGGWGVDALLGMQTRMHEDLDIAILHKDVPKLRETLGRQGFKEIPRNDSWECNFVLEDDRGRQVDVHSCTFDENGKNIFGVDYPYESWQGSGTINGLSVRCVPADWMVKFHSGYKLDENDYRDVKALCDHFGFDIPPEYQEFHSPDTTQ